MSTATDERNPTGHFQVRVYEEKVKENEGDDDEEVNDHTKKLTTMTTPSRSPSRN